MNPFKFYLVTDTHYFEPSLGAEGKAYERYMMREQYFMKKSSAIIKTVFDDIVRDKETEFVLIPGDLSKNGEIESHKSFIKELNRLKGAGKKVFVITAGHDYGEKSRAFKNDEQIEVEGTDFRELYNLYYEFGYSQAIAVDENTLSYVAPLEGNLRLLAINCDSPGNPKGAIDERLMVWIKEQADKAKADGCRMIAINHYPIIPSVPVFDLVGDAKIKDWRNVASFLADNGIELILTGHMHIQSINEFVSEKGNRLVDVCTACLVGSPAKYRKITLTDSKAEVESISVPDFGVDMKGKTAKEFFDAQFKYSIINRIKGIFDSEKFVLKLAGKLVNKLTVGALGRILFINVDKSLKTKKLLDFAGETGVAIFAGDQPYVADTPEYAAISKALRRFRFILKKVEPKLSKNGVAIDLEKMLLDTIGNNKGFSDNNATIKF